MKKPIKTALRYSEGVTEQMSAPSGKWSALLESELLADLFGCLLLGCALSLSLLSLTELEDYTLWSCLAFGAAACVVVALFRLRWWIVPGVLALTLLGNVIIRALTDDLARWAGYCWGMVRWLAAGAYYDPVYSESGGLVLFQALFVLGAVFLLYPLVRRPVLFPLTLTLSGGVILFVYFLEPGDISRILCPWAAGIILLLPGFYARALGQDGKGKSESRARMQLVALPIALLAAGVSWLIVPEDTGEWRSRILVNVVADFQSLWKDPNAAWPAAPPNFSLADMGFQAQKDRLGGPAKLRNQQTLTVLTDSPHLLKGRVMDVYTGQNWEASLPDGDYRFESILFRSSRREAFDQDRPLGGRQARRLYNDLTKEISLEVTYEYSGSTSLFYAGRPRRLSFTDRLIDAQGFYNLRAELYMHLRMPSKQGYALTTRVWDTGKSDFEEEFLRLEALSAEARDPRYAPISSRYTVLPETLPDSVRELATEITQDSASPYEKAKAISAWLAANAAYTLEPALPPENADFVEYFLKTKEGYCTYYASALAVMARCVGIPSRYVTGFALKASGEDRYVATSRTAHAWAEIYLSGLGWIEIDPLAWNADTPLNEPEELVLPEVEAPAPVRPRIVPSPEAPKAPAYAETLLTNEIRTPNWGLPIAIVIAAIGAYSLIRLTIRRAMRGKSRAYNLDRVLAQIPTMPKRLEYYHRDILRQLKLLDFDAQPGETLLTFSRRVDRRFHLEGVTFREVAGVLMEYHFAGREPTADGLRRISLYHEALEAHLLERLGRTVYLFRRGSLWP